MDTTTDLEISTSWEQYYQFFLYIDIKMHKSENSCINYHYQIGDHNYIIIYL